MIEALYNVIDMSVAIGILRIVGPFDSISKSTVHTLEGDLITVQFLAKHFFFGNGLVPAQRRWTSECFEESRQVLDMVAIWVADD
jgi:hypothetical protein